MYETWKSNGGVVARLLLRNEGTQTLQRTLTLLWFYSISINKSSEIGITWTNLANYELCALSSQAQISNLCPAAFHLVGPSTVRYACASSLPRVVVCIKGSMPDSVFLQSWEPGLSLHPSPGIGRVMRGRPSFLMPQHRGSPVQWVLLEILDTGGTGGALFLHHQDKQHGWIGQMGGPNIQFQLRGLCSLCSWCWWGSESSDSELFPYHTGCGSYSHLSHQSRKWVPLICPLSLPNWLWRWWWRWVAKWCQMTTCMISWAFIKESQVPGSGLGVLWSLFV